MFGWLRRKHTDRPDSTGWSDDAVPTPHERRDELLSAYLDDDLDASERAELDARLASDPDLGEALEGMRTVRDTLASLEVVRAPRSFAITTPTAPARRGFRPIDLAARAGTMVAVVAFVVVLAGDLSGGDGTPIVQERTSESLSTEAADSAGGGAADEAAESTGDNNGGAAGSQPAPAPGADDADADDADAEAVTASGPASDGADDAATPEAPVLDSDATVQAAAAATAERSATEEASAPGAAAPQPSDGSDPANDGASTDGADAADGAASDDPPPLPPNSGGALEPPADATPDAIEEAVAPSADPSSAPQDLQQDADAADSDRVAGVTAAGTVETESALDTQPAESFAATDADEAQLFAEDGREVSSLAIGLGVVAATLAAASGLLWWRHRTRDARPSR